jgi:hypothetical protein
MAPALTSSHQAIAILLDPAQPPRVYPLLGVPEQTLVLDGERFDDVGLGDWIGFYDWRRTLAGQAVGVRLWPDPHRHPALDAAANCRLVERSADGRQLCIYFADDRDGDAVWCDDQDFGDNRLFRGPRRMVMTFNAP